MGHEYEPGSKDALYDELRRRLVRKQNRDAVDRYQETLQGVRDRVGRTGEHIGSVLAGPTSVWIAGAITVVLTGFAIFFLLSADPNPPLSDQENALTDVSGKLAGR